MGQNCTNATCGAVLAGEGKLGVLAHRVVSDAQNHASYAAFKDALWVSATMHGEVATTVIREGVTARSLPVSEKHTVRAEAGKCPGSRTGQELKLMRGASAQTVCLAIQHPDGRLELYRVKAESPREALHNARVILTSQQPPVEILVEEPEADDQTSIAA